MPENKLLYLSWTPEIFEKIISIWPRELSFQLCCDFVGGNIVESLYNYYHIVNFVKFLLFQKSKETFFHYINREKIQKLNSHQLTCILIGYFSGFVREITDGRHTTSVFKLSQVQELLKIYPDKKDIPWDVFLLASTSDAHRTPMFFYFIVQMAGGFHKFDFEKFPNVDQMKPFFQTIIKKEINNKKTYFQQFREEKLYPIVELLMKKSNLNIDEYLESNYTSTDIPNLLQPYKMTFYSKISKIDPNISQHIYLFTDNRKSLECFELILKYLSKMETFDTTSLESSLLGNAENICDYLKNYITLSKK